MTSQKDLKEIRNSLETTFSMFKAESEVRSYIGSCMSDYLTRNFYTNSRCEDIYRQAMAELQEDIKEKYEKIRRKIKSYIKSLKKRTGSVSKYDDFGNAGVAGSAALGAGVGAGLALILGGPVGLGAGAVAFFAGLYGSSQNKQRLIRNIMEQAKKQNDEAISNLKAALDPLIPEEIVAKEEAPVIPLAEKERISSREDVVVWAKPIEAATKEMISEPKRPVGIASTTPIERKSYGLTAEQVEIRSFLEKRAIKYLVHFTDAASYDSIKKNGILSVAEAKRRGIAVTVKDSGYYNGSTSGVFARERNPENYISLSVTQRNDKVLSAYLYRGAIDKAVVLYIDASILWREIGHGRLYCTMNAKAGSVSYGRTIRDFENMFASEIVQSKWGEPDEVFARGWKDSNLPTHPQAEILFEGSVDPKYIDFTKVEVKG